MALIQGPALALPLVALAVPIGVAIDRWPRRPILVVALIVATLATLASAYATDFLMLFASRCCAGVAFLTITVAVYSLVGDTFEPSARGRASMVVALGQVGGSSAAFALGGYLLYRIGPGAESWHSAVLWMAVPFVPLILVALLRREPGRSGVVEARPPLADTWRQAVDHRSTIMILVAGMTMVSVADGAALVWTAPIFGRVFGMAPGQIGALLAATLLLSGVLGPVIGGMSADLSHRNGGGRTSFLVLALLAALSIPAAFYPVAPNAALAIMLFAVFLTIGIAISTMVIAVSIVLLPPHLRALSMSLQTGFGAIFGLGVAPVIVSGLSDVSGKITLGPALTIVCAITGVIGVVFFLVGRQAVRS
jgi:MFS family permease